MEIGKHYSKPKNKKEHTSLGFSYQHNKFQGTINKRTKRLTKRLFTPENNSKVETYIQHLFLLLIQTRASCQLP